MDKKQKRHQVIVKVCCVIVSFILWLFIYNVENPVRERKIVVPVQVINRNVLMQSNIISVDDENLTVKLTIKGNASDLYAVKSSQFELTSDLGSYVVKKGKNKIPVQIKKSPGSVRVVNSDNLWVNINIEDLKSKVVPVKLTLLGKAKSGFYAKEPKLSSTKVTVKGAKKDIEKVAKTETMYNIQNISKDVNRKVYLKAEDSQGNIIKNVEIEPKYLDMSIPVVRVKSVPVNVNLSGNLSDYGINSILPMNSNVDITGSDAEIAKVSKIDTEGIDISSINGRDSIDVKVNLPYGVTLLNGSDTVRLKVDFDKSSQKQVSVNIQTVNLDSSYSASLSASTVNVVVSGSKYAVDNLKDGDISASVDLKGVKQGQNTVPINITLPSGITEVSQDINQVTVTVSERNGETKNAG